MQPSSANKLLIVHILGLLSNLFSTFDLNKQSERLEVMRPVQTQPHNDNPVWQAIKTQKSNQLLLIKWAPNICSGRFSGGGCPAAGLPSDPDHCQQVAEWTRSGRGQCVWTCVCVCGSIWMIGFSLAPSQAVCAVFEKSLKTLLRDFAPLVTQLCELIGQMFGAYPQASALDLTRQVMT